MIFLDNYNIYILVLDEEFGEHSVVVNLDGVQSEMILIDHPSGEMSVSMPYNYIITMQLMCRYCRV